MPPNTSFEKPKEGNLIQQEQEMFSRVERDNAFMVFDLVSRRIHESSR